MKLITVCFILALHTRVGFGTILPLLQPLLCSLSSNNISACIINDIETIWPQLVSGNYGNGVTGPALDPYELDVNISNANGLNGTLRNTYIYGARNFKISSLTISANTIYATVVIPVLLIKGQYTLSMNYGGFLPINGGGPFNMTDTNTKITALVKLVVNQNNTVTFPPISLSITFNNPTFYLSGLFPGYPAMDGFANQLINASPGIILNEVQPSITKKLAATYNTVINKLLPNVTFSELFLP